MSPKRNVRISLSFDEIAMLRVALAEWGAGMSDNGEDDESAAAHVLSQRLLRALSRVTKRKGKVQP